MSRVEPYTTRDYLYREHNEPVTIQYQAGEPVAIEYGLRTTISKREADRSEGAYTAQDVRWHLPIELVPSRPKPKDVISAESGDFVVLAVDDRLRSRWVCTCRRLQIEQDLADLLVVAIENSTRGPDGRPRVRLDTVWANIRGKIQEFRAASTAEQGRRKIWPTHVVYLERYLPLRAHHVIQGPDGRSYRVLGYQDPAELDRLPAVEVRIS